MQTDVAVVGGGAAGVAAAIALQGQGAGVIVIDRGIPHPLLGESLPPATTPVLRELGLLADFVASGQHPVYGNRSTWGSAQPVDLDFIRSPHGNGWRLDRPAFDRMLAHALTSRRIPYFAHTRVLALERSSRPHWDLTLADLERRTQLVADVVIDATGRSRQLARMMGVPRLTYDRLIAMVGIFRPGFDTTNPDTFTEIEAAPDGWWYASVLPDGSLVTGYLTDADNETVRIARTHDGFLQLLGQTADLSKRVTALGYVLRRLLRPLPAGSSRLDHAAGKGWCAVGDAAAAHDPLSSQGILAALESGRRAGEAISSSAPGAMAVYDESMSEAYARYLAAWLGYYALEQRWPRHEFWRRRHQALLHVLGREHLPLRSADGPGQ